MRIAAVLFSLFFLFSNCAHFKKPATKKPPALPTAGRPGPAPAKKEEVKKPHEMAPVSTPKRKASSLIVEKGVIELGGGNTERALELFEEALNVDTTNGEAYYYLALTNSKLGNQKEALGLLEKARELLQYDKDWIQKIDELKYKITGQKDNKLVPEIIDEY